MTDYYVIMNFFSFPEKEKEELEKEKEREPAIPTKKNVMCYY